MAPQIQMQLSKADEIKVHLDITRSWFDESRTDSELIDASEATYQWLISNAERYNSEYLLERKPWFDEALSLTSDPRLIELRKQSLRYLVWEHGVQAFLLELESRGVVEEVPGKCFEYITDGNTRAVLEQLIMLDITSNGENSSNLEELTRQFNIAEPKRVRDGPLVRLASIGFVSARTDKRTYVISLGTVARTFYSRIYLPILAHFERKLIARSYLCH